MAPSCPRYSFRLLLPGVLGFGSVRHEPCPTTNFLISYFRWREGFPTSVLGSQPIIWLLPSSPLARRSVRATICHHVSHSFSIRTPSTNICFSILTWMCYFGIDPHSYDVLTVILWWLATVNSNTRIVVILFLSSQWDTTWQYINYLLIGEKRWIHVFPLSINVMPQKQFRPGFELWSPNSVTPQVSSVSHENKAKEFSLLFNLPIAGRDVIDSCLS